MKPRVSDVEWVAFAAISRFLLCYLGHHPIGSFLAFKTNILMVLHAIPRIGLRSAPATAGILAPRGNDVRNPVNTGIYARRWISFWV